MKKTLRIRLFSERKKQNFQLRGRQGGTSQKGFTLIEMIVTLVIVGIMAALGGMGIVQAVKGYIIVKENAATTQKAQLAMSRITREIIELNNIPSAVSATRLPITNISQMDAAGSIVGDRTIEFVSAENAVKINDDVLIDHVKSLAFTYSSGSNNWTYGSDINLLSAIAVNMTVTTPQGQDLNFYTLVAPRNNGNLGGATLPGAATVNIPSSWGIGCFVATAAYGNPAHPMVQILRDFRDTRLSHWSWGRWFIKQYYEHGPAAADMIRNRSLAMFMTRCLLAPVVALIFCWMYAPLMIPFVFFISLIITMAVSSAFRRKFKPGPGISRSRGSILIGLIITMVIMAILAAAMLPLFSSSSMNQVYADQGRRAYFLAESGFTYASSRFRDAETDADKDVVLADMHGKTYHLLDNAGSFTIKFYPYWFKTTAVDSNLSTQVSAGYVPPQLNSISGGGNIRVCSPADSATCGDYSYTSTDAVTAGDTTLTFNGISKLAGSSAASGWTVYPVILSSGSSAVVNRGSISISANGAAAFPQLNGTFTLDPLPAGLSGNMVFKYEKKVGTSLQNITLADSTKIWKNFTVPADTKIILDKFLRVYSTGTAGSASRQIIYNAPVGWMSGNQWNSAETLIKGISDNPNALGDFSQVTVDGNAVLRVDSVVDSTVGATGWAAGIISSFVYALRDLFGLPTNYPGVWSIQPIDLSNEETNPAKAFKDQCGCLSYDLQVKIDASTKKYFMNGMGFRLRNNAAGTDAYGYGVSIMRKRQTRYYTDAGCGITFDNWGDYEDLAAAFSWKQNDGINSEFDAVGFGWSGEEQVEGNLVACLKARYSQPVIALWQRTSAGFKVLAYRAITAGDALVTGTGADLRLNPWVTLMARVIEGYELQFTSGRVDGNGRHFKNGDTIMAKNADGSIKATARVVGTPVMFNAWGASNTASGTGRLLLNCVTGGSFASGDNLYLVNGDGSSYGTSSAAQAASKTNYIMVYYSDNKTPATGDTIQANNTRVGNVHYTTETEANWPPDDWTDRSAENDYFTLVKWQNVTPSGALTLSWTYGCGWQSGGTGLLQRVVCLGAELAPAINTSNWSKDSGWTISTGRLQKDYMSGGDYAKVYPTTSINVPAGTYYVYMDMSNYGSGYLNYSLGDYSHSSKIKDDVDENVTVTTPGNIILKANADLGGYWANFRINSVSVKPHIQPATAYAPVNLTAGVNYTVSVGTTTFTSGSNYIISIDGNSQTCNTAACSLTFKASATGTANLTFSSPSLSSISDRFTTGSISITPQQDVLNNTWASLVPVADASADFYNAVVKSNAIVSPSGSSYQDFIDGGGDFMALITSSFEGVGTYYDDFAVKTYRKGSSGFLPPIQQ